MKILLTGSKGFTGHHFIQMAQEDGHTVIPLASDLLQPEQIREELGRTSFSHVVHLAAMSYVGHGDARAFYDVNLFGTLNLLDALSAMGTAPDRTLIASSANVYGNAVVSPIRESTPPAPVNHYASSKLAMEHMARTYAFRLPLFFVRPFNYTGPGQSDSFLIPKLVAHFRSRATKIELGNLDVVREYNDVRMVCSAYLRLLERAEAGETYNVCTGQGYSLLRVIAMLEGLTGHVMDVEVNPRFVRQSEVHELLGDPSRLTQSVGSLTGFAFSETLDWMLKSPPGQRST